MPTVIRVKFRRDGHKDGRFEPAYSEDLDLDQLTPRARALAEALHACMQPYTEPRVDALGVLFECDLTNAELAEQGIPRWKPEYGPVKDPDKRAQRVVPCGPFPKASQSVRLVDWLETSVREFPLIWYPIGVRNGPRVPSWEAGAADRYLTRDQVLAYLRDRGAGMSLQAWTTLIPTPILAPDRIVQGKPQWRPETVQAFIGRARDLWPLSRVAEFLGLTSGSARVQMRRWGLAAESRDSGRGGESLYAADLVQAAHAHRPGRGARTDLRGSDD